MRSRYIAPIISLLTLMAALIVPSIASACVCDGKPLGAAAPYTEFIFENGVRGSESEGAIAYGGSLNASGMTVGTRLPSSTAKTDPTLVVNGSVSGGFNLQKGSAYVPNRGNNTVNFNGQGSYLSSAPVNFASAYSELDARFRSWLTAGGSYGTATVVDSAVTGTNIGGNVLWLKGTDSQENLFTVTPSQLVGIRGVFVKVPAGSTALVNIAASGVVQIDGETRFYSSSSNSYRQADDSVVEDAVSRTIWNAPNASEVKINSGAAFGGHIFATNALVNVVSAGHTNGQIIAKSLSSAFETHRFMFPDKGCIPSAGGETPSPTPTPTPTVKKPLITVSKSASATIVAPGETVNFTLKASNTGQSAASTVTLTDAVPNGLTVVSVPEGCTLSGSTVKCTAASVAAGSSVQFTFVARADALASVNNSGNDQLSAFKNEQHISLLGGQTQTFVASCGSGYNMTDASVRIDHVDDGTGTLADVKIISAHPLADGSYQVVIANGSTGQAQAKLFIACINATTTEGYSTNVSAIATQTHALAVGTQNITVSCGTGRVPVVPSIDILSGAATVIGNAPGASPETRVFTLNVTAAGQAQTFVRCLSTTATKPGATAALQLRSISQTVTVPAGGVSSFNLTCGPLEKGIVAGWKVNGAQFIGHEPQPVTRVFWFYNPSSTPVSATLYLLCMNVRTTNQGQAPRDIANTVVGASSSTLDSDSVLSASIPVRVQNGGTVASASAVSVLGDVAVAPATIALPLPVIVAVSSKQSGSAYSVNLAASDQADAKVTLQASSNSKGGFVALDNDKSEIEVGSNRIRFALSKADRQTLKSKKHVRLAVTKGKKTVYVKVK